MVWVRMKLHGQNSENVRPLFLPLKKYIYSVLLKMHTLEKCNQLFDPM